MIFMRDPNMHLHRTKLGPSVDLREGRKERALARAKEAQEGGEEEETPLVWKERKTTDPRKRKQAAPGSTFAPKKTRYINSRLQNFLPCF